VRFKSFTLDFVPEKIPEPLLEAAGAFARSIATSIDVAMNLIG
jgi:hypothetical protein